MDASLCQDVALGLQLSHLPAQAGEFLALGRRQALLAGQRLAAVTRVLRDPVGDALSGGAELTRQLRRRPAGAGELDDLLAKFRRIRRLGPGHSWTPIP